MMLPVLSAGSSVEMEIVSGRMATVFPASIGQACGLVEGGAVDLVVAADEAGGEGGDWFCVDAHRTSRLLNAAGVEKLDDVAHDHGFVLVVGDENGGQTQLEMDLADARLQFFAQLGVDG